MYYRKARIVNKLNNPLEQTQQSWSLKKLPFKEVLLRYQFTELIEY